MYYSKTFSLSLLFRFTAKLPDFDYILNVYMCMYLSVYRQNFYADVNWIVSPKTWIFEAKTLVFFFKVYMNFCKCACAHVFVVCFRYTKTKMQWKIPLAKIDSTFFLICLLYVHVHVFFFFVFYEQEWMSNKTKCGCYN